MLALLSRLSRNKQLLVTSLSTGVMAVVAGLAAVSCGSGSSDAAVDDTADASQVVASEGDASTGSDAGGNTKKPACTSDAQCTDKAKPHCDVASGTCVEPPAACDATHPCAGGKACCGGACVDETTDANNCGACGKACGAGASCCKGACVDPKTDVANCGGCGTACTTAHGAATCTDGKCGLGTCETGFDDCDKNPANGCEVDLRVSASNCGGCGNACSGNHITATCAGGQCVGVCDANFLDCNSDKRTDGCELDVSTPTSQTFDFTGAMQTITVPSCLTHAKIQVYGAQGGNAKIGGTGGLGGYAEGILTVAPGSVLNVFVGGQNGYNGGGTGGRDGNTTYGGTDGTLAPSGGGASDVRVNGTALADRVIVAGGGGGAGDNGTWPACQTSGPAGNGGAGGALDGLPGTAGTGSPCNCGGGGGGGGAGGTQANGGTHGTYSGSTACLRANWTAGGDGSLGQGGSGSTVYYNGQGGSGGGGGGWYGGGAGANGSDTTPGGGGGGGASYVGALASASTTAGVRSGNGRVIITFTP